MTENLARGYAGVAAVLLPFVVVLVWLSNRESESVASHQALLLPVFALVALTILVLVVAAVIRNVSVMRGVASIDYYRTYRDGHPGEHIERAARIYDNLLQLPLLFYVICTLLMLTGHSDSVQVSLAWLFVVSRYLHAVVYMVWNVVPYRFATFFMGVLTLIVMWTRFVLAAA